MQAYFTASDSKTNVFTLDIQIEDFVKYFVLMEHCAVDSNKDGSYELTSQEVISNDYNIYPGVNIPKDPFIKIDGLTKDAYLFVEIIGESNSDFAWSVKDSWLKTELSGHNGGTVYAYKGQSNSVSVLDETSGASFIEYILNGIDGSENGGINVSDTYRRSDKIDIIFYGYLIQADGFDSYVDAYNAFVY
jgi:hypothetical protein